MKEPCDDRRLLHVVNSVVGEPVEGFEEEQDSEEGHKLRAEVIPEDCEGQTSLRHSIEETLDQVLWTQEAVSWK